MLKKLVFIAIFVFPFISALSGTIPFVTTWKTDNIGVSTNNQITIPTFLGEVYNYTVDWGDGQTSVNVTGDITHNYATAGTYTVSITGTFPRIYFNDAGDKLKLLSVDQWGNNIWTSMESAFYGCENMQGTYADVPNLSIVTNMAQMFREAGSFNWPVNSWDVSSVQNMIGLFQNASSFNRPLNNWNVSNVVSMRNMFNNFIDGETIVSTVTPVPGTAFSNILREVFFTGAFNQEISNWDVSKVEDMSGMFLGTPFNQPIGNWNVGNVLYMSSMFEVAINFNQDLSLWDVSNVLDMSYMFGDAKNFNQLIDSWDVSMVSSIRGMFSYASEFNQTINSWNIDSLIDMGELFLSATNFNQDMSAWDVSGVNFMDGAFQNMEFFNQDISGWDVGNVTTMRTMFLGSDAFNQNLNTWNVSNVTDFAGMFAYNEIYNQPMDNWDMGSAIDLSAMFGFAESFNQDISGWDVSNVEQMRFMFYQAFAFEQDLGTWDVSSLITAVNMFSGVELSIENYDSLLIGWESAIINNDVSFDGGLSKYCAGESARERLMDVSNWAIIDAGKIAFEITALADQEREFSYALPQISGVNLTGNEAYYTESGGQGIKYEEGQELAYSETETYPITIYLYDETIAQNPCSAEQEFELILTKCGVAVAPIVNDPGDQTGDHSFTLPEITGVNLSGNEAYYTEIDGQGVKYLEGDILYYSDFTSFPIDLYIYDEKLLNGYSCESEVLFELTITETLPLCTNLISPFNGEENVQVDLNGIEWNEIYNAEGYDLKIGTTPFGNEIIDANVVNDTFFNFIDELPSAQEIYVTIAPYNSIGSAIGCSNQFKTETNIKIPKFFTPNDDGVNDEWTVPNPFNSFDKAFIYDRFGKLLQQIINPDTKGWDGIFAGKPMPSDSYWYLVTYKTGEVFKGSFALVR